MLAFNHDNRRDLNYFDIYIYYAVYTKVFNCLSPESHLKMNNHNMVPFLYTCMFLFLAYFRQLCLSDSDSFMRCGLQGEVF